jgi:signal transduction histidine kinase
MTIEDARLLQRVRLQLALWSGGVTLVLLLLPRRGPLHRSGSLAVEFRDRRSSSTRRTGSRAAAPGRTPCQEGGFNFGGPGSGTFTMVLDQDGDPVGPGGRIPQGLPVVASIDAARATGQTDIREATVPIGGNPIEEATLTPVRVLTEPVLFRGQQLYLQIVGDRTTEERTLNALVLVLVVGGAVALVVASGVGAAYASRALVPIRRSLVGQREALRRQREFAADASHELRTPLTVIRVSVDDLERHPKDAVAERRLRADRYPGGGRSPDLDGRRPAPARALGLGRRRTGARARRSWRRRVVGGLVAHRRARPIAASGWSVDPAPAEVVGDPSRLRQLVAILVDNAFRHAPAGARSASVCARRPATRSSSSRTRGRASDPRTCRVSSTGSIGAAGRARWRDRPRSGDRGLDRRAARRPHRGGEPRAPRRRFTVQLPLIQRAPSQVSPT